MINWIRVKFYNFLAPAFALAINQGLQEHLKDYYRNQREDTQKADVHMAHMRDWMANMEKHVASDSNHEQFMKRLDRMIELLENKA